MIRLRLPSLRERREDIPLLARHFLAKSARELGVEAKRLSDAAMKYLVAQDLPGNVRQLENVCHWLTVMAPGQMVDVGDLPPELREDAAAGTEADWTAALEREVEKSLMRGESSIMDVLTREFEKALIARALAHTGGRRIEAAQPARHRPQHAHPQDRGAQARGPGRPGGSASGVGPSVAASAGRA